MSSLILEQIYFILSVFTYFLALGFELSSSFMYARKMLYAEMYPKPLSFVDYNSYSNSNTL